MQTPSVNEFLAPVLALVLWTAIMGFWLYFTRVPAMKKARIHPDKARHKGWESALPSDIRAVADNYNHLHEQPTIFYALMFYTAVVGHQSAWAMYVAWLYVVGRVVHSLVQALSPKVMLRFIAFSIVSLFLLILLALELWASLV